MKLSHISSQSVTNALRSSIKSMQSSMVAAQKEVATGRLADASLALGVKHGRLVSLMKDSERISAVSDTNARVTARLNVSLKSVGQIGGISQDLMSSLTSSLSGSADPSLTLAAARTAIADITAALNTSFDGGYIFAGVNTSARPIADYENGAASAAVNAAFQTYFGFPKSDAQAGFITESQMDAFVTAEVEPLFMSAGWNASLSSASDQVIRARITLSETADTSVTANEPGFRKALFGAALSVEFFSGALSAAASSAIAKRSAAALAEAASEMASLEGRAGFTLQRVAQATNRLTLQSDFLTSLGDGLTAVDPYEASTRLNALLTQIETSYALTARIQNLSFLRFMQ